MSTILAAGLFATAVLLLRQHGITRRQRGRNAVLADDVRAREEELRRLVTVRLPALADHPGHAVARRQMRRFGGMVSFELDADLETATRFASSTRLFQLAESLGGVESLLDHPATMTHGSIPRAQRLASGFTDGLLRLSVGLEDLADLEADLDQAFRAALS